MKTFMKLFVLSKGEIGKLEDISIFSNITVSMPNKLTDANTSSIPMIVSLAIQEMVNRELGEKIREGFNNA